jgi:hypothetical protein
MEKVWWGVLVPRDFQVEAVASLVAVPTQDLPFPHLKDRQRQLLSLPLLATTTLWVPLRCDAAHEGTTRDSTSVLFHPV